jgi:hypothetical protein
MATTIPANRQFPFFTTPKLQTIYDGDNIIPFDGVTCMVGCDSLLFCGCYVCIVNYK